MINVDNSIVETNVEFVDGFLEESFSNNGIFVVKNEFIVVFSKINFVDEIISLFK